jgi:hypothetical protein
MGVPVHGILGYDFFKDFVVETNCTKKRMTFYKPLNFKIKRCKNCKNIPLQFYKEKLCINEEVSLGSLLIFCYS